MLCKSRITNSENTIEDSQFSWICQMSHYWTFRTETSSPNPKRSSDCEKPEVSRGVYPNIVVSNATSTQKCTIDNTFVKRKYYLNFQIFWHSKSRMYQFCHVTVWSDERLPQRSFCFCLWHPEALRPAAPFAFPKVAQFLQGILIRILQLAYRNRKIR